MTAFRILVWAANLAAIALLFAAVADRPPGGLLPIALGCLASVMSLTLAYVWVLEAAQRKQDAGPDVQKSTWSRVPKKSAGPRSRL